jgi:hypothetical protein
VVRLEGPSKATLGELQIDGAGKADAIVAAAMPMQPVRTDAELAVDALRKVGVPESAIVDRPRVR